MLNIQLFPTMDAKDKIANEEGQAIFEFIVFLPFFIFLFTVMATIGNSINGSINQQKSVRSYYYYLLKGNSYFPTHNDIQTLSKSNTFAGFLAIGWRERSDDQGSSAYSPCYKFTLFPGSEQKKEETCDDPIEAGSNITNLVRVYTYYGVCSESYIIQNGKGIANFYEKGVDSCTVRQ